MEAGIFRWSMNGSAPPFLASCIVKLVSDESWTPAGLSQGWRSEREQRRHVINMAWKERALATSFENMIVNMAEEASRGRRVGLSVAQLLLVADLTISSSRMLSEVAFWRKGGSVPPCLEEYQEASLGNQINSFAPLWIPWNLSFCYILSLEKKTPNDAVTPQRQS